MRSMLEFILLPLMLVTSACQAQPRQQPQQQATNPKETGSKYLHLTQTIPLTDVEGRIDHLSIDLKGMRLFVAALGNKTVEVLDLQSGKKIKSISGFEEPQGVRYIAALGKLVVADGGGDGTVKVFDGGGDAFTLQKTINLGGDADNVRYDDESGQIFVGYGDGGLAMIDPQNGQVINRIKLEAHPESFQLEKVSGAIYLNVPNKEHVAVIDRKRGAVTAVWPLADAGANFPMALDEANHRLFIGCRKPDKVLVCDTVSGKQVASVTINGDTDDLFYDAARKRLYVSCGEGFVNIIEQRDANHYEQVAKITTASGARTSLFIPEQNRLYLAVPHRGSQQAAIYVYQAF